ncbi:MAG: sensor histidine kinase [Almyronema sp.]
MPQWEMSVSEELLANPTILIVDDNPANLGVLCHFLDDAGLKALVAQDGESALEKVAYAPPDLILLDVMMPGIDGFETCRRLKRDAKTADIPVIFMTALAETADKVKGLSLGAVDYITKPFEQEEVLARIRLHLKLQGLNQTLATRNHLLAEQTEALSLALQKIQLTQVQLVQGEKLASLGQLVAGIAHEINNPVGFVAGNLPHVQAYIHQLLAHLQLYQQHYCQPPSEIEDHAQTIDLDYLIEDLPKILASMQVGVERIQNISVALRNFSRADTARPAAVDIHDVLESTLLILNHRLKAEGNRPAIKVVKRYGDLPMVECYAEQLNQVLMNLMSNAIDALHDNLERLSYAASDPMLHIVTEAVDLHRIAIRIKDNGPGIAEALQAQLFTPFFTTKPAGKGTGLGLSISYQIIVEKHQGSLQCVSRPGEGAEFIIEIPVSQQNLTQVQALNLSQTSLTSLS